MRWLTILILAPALAGCTASGPALEPFTATEPADWLPDNINTSLRSTDSSIARVEGTRTTSTDAPLAEGEIRYYHDDGHLMGIAYYNAGRPNGRSVWLYPDGSIERAGQYVEGKPDGVFEHYYENGWIERRSTWKHGKQFGPNHRFYPDGTLHTLQTYDDNGRTIMGFRTWAEDTDTASRSITRDGRYLMEYSFTDSDDLEHVAVYLNEGRIVIWHPNQDNQRVLFFQQGEDFEMPITLPIVDFDD